MPLTPKYALPYPSATDPVAEGAAAIQALAEALDAALVPAATVIATAATTTPAGWLFCNGAAVSRTTYAALFAAIGTTYGVGDGSTTFGLPDLQGRVIAGLGTHADVDALGENDGSLLAARSPKHRHTLTGGIGANASGVDATGAFRRGQENQGYPAWHTLAVGPAGAPLDTPAYLVLRYLIKT
jgi:microcystin-dependent protein